MASSEDESCGGDEKRECRESSSVKCEECGENEAKYRCPGCGLRSCGLPCVKSHKWRTECDGQRKRTSFVRLSEYDDNVLISDYNFLEETLRLADSAKRLRVPLCGSWSGKIELHPGLKALQRQAKSRSTSLLFVAQGMSKRKANTSFFEMKTKRIFWRVEWMFEGTDIHFIDQRVDENLRLENVLAKHLNSDSGDVMVKHRLRNFRRKHLDELQFLLRKESCPASEKVFYELNHEESLRDHLVNKTIVEFPVITVVLPEDAGDFVIAPVERRLPKSFYELNHEESLRDHLVNKTFVEYPVITVGLPEDAGEYVIAPVERRLPKATDNDQADGPMTLTLHEPEGILLRREEIEEREPKGIPFTEEEIEEGEFVPWV